jgi:hypothetical protein
MRRYPSGLADYLRVARALLLESYFLYDFALVATMWTMLALESALRGSLDAGDSSTLVQLINQAKERGLIDDEGAAALHDVRKLRNSPGVIAGIPQMRGAARGVDR